MSLSTLHEADREWLYQHAEACRLLCDFIYVETFSTYNNAVISAAGNVPIWAEGCYQSAACVLRSIEKGVSNSQIFEEWEYRRYQDVMRYCRNLSTMDAHVLIVVAGFAKQNEDELYNYAAEAVSEAHEALYGY